MSITWILGILIVEIKELFTLAYIYTIMVAFQGFFIFLIFVVFSRATRAVYCKWWKLNVKLPKFFDKSKNDSTFRLQTISSALVSSTNSLELVTCNLVTVV